MKSKLVICALVASMVLATGCTDQNNATPTEENTEKKFIGNKDRFISDTEEVAGPEQINNSHEETEETIAESKIVVDGTEIDYTSDVDEVKEKLGKPETEEIGNTVEFYTYKNGKLLIDVYNDGSNRNITGVEVSTDEIETNRGIKVGDTKEAVIEKYGEPDAVEQLDDNHRYEYYIGNTFVLFITDAEDKNVESFCVSNLDKTKASQNM